MDLPITGEIRRNRALSDILDAIALLQHGIESETLGIGREHQKASLRQYRHARIKQLDMITLHVEHALHSLAVRERRWVAENQIKSLLASRSLAQPLAHIRVNQSVPLAPETIQFQIAPTPIEVSRR